MMHAALRGLAVLLLMLPVCGMLWLVSPAGTGWLTNRIEASLSQSLGVEAEMDALTLHWPLRVRIGGFRLRDAATGQAYVEGEQLMARISARRLLRGQLYVYALHAGAIQYRGWPAARPSPAVSSGYAGLPAALGPVTLVDVQHWQVGALTVADGSTWALSGSVRGDLAKDVVVARIQVGVPPAAAPARAGSLVLQFAHSRTAPQLRVELEGRQADTSVSVKLESAAAGIDMRVQAGGEVPAVWRFAVQGELDWDWRALRLEAIRLREMWLQWDEQEVELEQAMTLRRLPDGYRLDDLQLRAGQGRLRASGLVTGEELLIEAEVLDVSLSQFGFAGVPIGQGEMQGSLRVRGHPANPAAQAELLFTGLMPADTRYWDGPSATFTVTHTLANRRLKNHYELQVWADKTAELLVDLPLHLSLLPFELSCPPEGALSGHLHAEADLSELAALFVLDVHRLQGALEMDMQLGGTVATPEWSGGVYLRDGAYENDLYGTVLRDLQVVLSGERQRIELQQFTATDGGTGRLEMVGGMDLQPQSDYPFSASLSLHRFRLLNHETIAAHAEGDLVWTGQQHHSEVQGQIHVGPAEFRIPERMPPSLIDLNVNDSESMEMAIEEGNRDTHNLKHELNLNINVLVPERLFVRGRGLDSEWGGQLQVNGPVREPVVTGVLSILRGRFVFFGKRLALTRGGITLDGATPPAPGLDVVAEAKAGDVTAMMTLSGAVDAPEIELSSVPELPQDEILAQLLFGRASTRITPWQAVTIAQAVNRLRGGNTFDLMGETRRLLHVDQIELRDTGEEGELAISVGKYINDRIFVEIERGSESEGTTARVEIELTPSIRMESVVGTEADASLGLSWTWDY
jgi:translocation and assembly module TamB